MSNSVAMWPGATGGVGGGWLGRTLIRQGEF